MCIRDSVGAVWQENVDGRGWYQRRNLTDSEFHDAWTAYKAVSYTHLRAHETVLDIVCRLLLEKKNRSTIDGRLLSKATPTPQHGYEQLHPISE